MPDFTTPIFNFTEPTVGADNGTWGGILNTDTTNLDTYLGVLRQAAKAVTVGATTTLDFNSPASVFSFTVNQATTIAFANVPANITTQQLSTQATIIITNGGAFAVTWPASVTWSGGVAPSLQAAGTDVVVLWSPNNGTNWYGAQLLSGTSVRERVIGQLANTAPISTPAGTETSLGTIMIPAGTLTANGQMVRIRFTVKDPGDASGTLVRIKFGSTYVVGATAGGITLAQNQIGCFEVLVSRTGAFGELADAWEDISAAASGPNATTRSYEPSVPVENIGNPIVVDFRVTSNGSGFSVGIRQALVELVST